MTDRANPMVITEQEVLAKTRENLPKYNKLAELISIETGVPKERIFAGYLLNFVNNWYKIGDNWYFYKHPRNGFNTINELLGVEISRYFGLDTVDYQLARLKRDGKEDEIGLVSKNVCDPNGSYLSCWDCKIYNYRNLEFLEHGIKGLCITPEAEELFANDVKALMVRDLYTQQLDRSGYNVLLKSTNDGLRLGPLYDYERSFDCKEYRTNRGQFGELNVYRKACKEVVLNDPHFQELFNKYMEADISTFIEQVEVLYGVAIYEELNEHY